MSEPRPYESQPEQPYPGAGHYPPTPGYGTGMAYPGPGGYAPEHPQGTLILVLGILGFFTTVTGVVAWVLGTKALNQIKASGVHPSNEQSIVIGRILGIITTILGIVAVAFVIIWVIIVFAIVGSAAAG